MKKSELFDIHEHLIDKELTLAQKKVSKWLMIFHSTAVNFIISMQRNIETHNQLIYAFNKFMDDNAELWVLYQSKRPADEEILKAEAILMPTFTRFRYQINYSSLSLLYSYSIFIEEAINHDKIIYEHPFSKKKYTQSGLGFKKSTHTWIELVVAAANYSRHFGEWTLLFKTLASNSNTIEHKLSLLKQQNPQAHQSISKLIKLNGNELVLSNPLFDFAESLIISLELNDFEKSQKRMQLWLRRMEKHWGEQVKNNPGKYFDFNSKNPIKY